MSFQLDADEQSYAGSELILRTIRIMRETYESEKVENGLSQQKIAKKLGLKHRSIVNRWLLGKENMGLRSIGELAWAMNRRAVITFEKCNETDGNFTDVNPYAVADVAEDTKRITNASSGIDAWRRAGSQIRQYESVLENV